MALPGYPQTHNSPDIVVAAQDDITKHEGPFSSVKILSDGNTDSATVKIYLDKAGYDANSTEGVDFYTVELLATDSIAGPLYGFRLMATGSDAGITGIAYRYSTSIL